MDLGPWTTMKSLLWVPLRARPAARSGKRESASILRYSSSARTAGMAETRVSISPSMLISPQGKALAAAGLVDVFLQGFDGGKPGGGDGHGGFRHVGFEASEPYRVGAGFLEQEVAFPHDFFEDGDAGGMFGIEGGHQAVEKAPSVARRPGKEAVHGGGEPEHAHVFAERPGALLQVAVDQHEAARCGAIGFAGGRLQPVPSFTSWLGVATSAAMAQEEALCRLASSSKLAPRKSAPGREQRDGFKQIGLARAIGAGEGDEARRDVQPEAGIIAEIRQRQAGESKAS